MKRLISVCLLCALPVIAFAQLPATGRILVATPALADANFTETVVLLIHHGEEGSLGLFLNRPTWIDGAEQFLDLESLEVADRTLYLGGPAQMTQLLILTARTEAAEGLNPILDGVQLTADPALITDPAQQQPASFRIYAGHAAWAAGQLESEIDDGYWHVIEGSAGLVFSDAPEGLWQLATQRAESSLTAHAPPPPSITGR